jgi:hypothetical protein
MAATPRREGVTHGWRLEPRQAMALQRQLAAQVVLAEAPVPALILGLDCAFRGDEILAVGVVWDVVNRRVRETRAARMPVGFPYVPGLLSFRELPVMRRVIARTRSADWHLAAYSRQGQPGLRQPRTSDRSCEQYRQGTRLRWRVSSTGAHPSGRPAGCRLQAGGALPGWVPAPWRPDCAGSIVRPRSASRAWLSQAVGIAADGYVSP